ncbi:MAG: AMP-binding protein [Prevotellaceae bacterium]|nr:AMP-binding protein [Prevotellaceae bacterium]
MKVDYIQHTQSMMRIMERTIRENWERPAFSDYGTSVRFTYKEAACEFARLHEYFHSLDLKRGDRIAICGKNSSQWAVAYLAAFTFGAVTVPILQDFNAEQIINIIVHSETKLLMCADDIAAKLGVTISGTTMLQLPPNDEGEERECPMCSLSTIGHISYDMPFGKVDVRYFADRPDDLAMLSYTSGSTGHSKGVMLPYRAMWSNVAFANEALGLKPGKKVVSLLPMAHMYGFAFEFMYAFCVGSHIHYLTKAPSPSVLLQVFADVRPHIIIAVPLIIEKIVQNKIFPVIRAVQMRSLLMLPIVRTLIYRKIRRQLQKVFGDNFYEIIVGGASFNSEVETFLKRIKFPYTVGYGMTECGPIICYRDWHSFAMTSCGRSAPRMEVRILSDDPERVPGEIVTRGMNVMLGYYKNDAATVETIDEDGWLHTGDLATMDSDGNVYIRGRVKNMLLGSNGQNIYPEEIEEKLTGHALIDECVVVQRGDKLVGLVYTSDDTLQRHGMTRDDFAEQLDRYRRHINRMLPTFCALSALESRTEEFEKTPKRNIRRFLYS